MQDRGCLLNTLQALQWLTMCTSHLVKFKPAVMCRWPQRHNLHRIYTQEVRLHACTPGSPGLAAKNVQGMLRSIFASAAQGQCQEHINHDVTSMSLSTPSCGRVPSQRASQSSQSC